MAQHQKIAILSNDIIRRLSDKNHKTTEKTEIFAVVEQFPRELKISATLATRCRKKLTEKTSWYLKKNMGEEENEKKREDWVGRKKQTRKVVEKQLILQILTGCNLKTVKRVGTRFEDMMHKSDQ